MVGKYSDAGVDTAAANTLIKRIAPFCKKTKRPEVIDADNGFAGLFGMPKGYKDAVFVSSTDGVGTKLKLAFAAGRHDTIGRDLVAMCVNDILVCGAEPLWFLDYFATGALNIDTAETVIKGIADGCADAGCTLLGGETAEMPDMYAAGEYDLAGFAVGVVERDAMFGAHRVKDGNAIVGIASSGVHSNGFSLVRRILDGANLKLDAPAPWNDNDNDNDTVAAQLLTPTTIYVRAIQTLISKLGQETISAMAHITGGGISENVPRVLNKGVNAIIKRDAWKPQPIFSWLQTTGNIDADEMLRVFNCGIGMVLIVDDSQVKSIIDLLAKCGHDAWHIGRVEHGSTSEHQQVIYE